MDTQVIQGGTLQVLRSFRPGTFDAVITDPPYASGGATKAEREKPSSEKYTNTKKSCPYPDIEGDAKDQRSWTNWMAEWLSTALYKKKPRLHSTAPHDKIYQQRGSSVSKASARH